MKKNQRMSLVKFRNYLRENGYKTSYIEFKGIYAPIKQAVYVWGDGCAEAAKIADEMDYKVEKDGNRYMIY